MADQTTALIAKATTFGKSLEALRASVEAVLPKHLTADRFLKIIRVAASQTPAIYDCTMQSINECVMTAGELGLDVSKARQHAALIPYRNKGVLELQFQPMYKGLIELALRDGRVRSIEAHVVHEKDQFKCQYGSSPVLQHEPYWGPAPGDTIAAYAVAKLASGETQWEVMTRAELDQVQKSSRAGSSDAPWKVWPDEMRRKTVVKRLCKWLPSSTDLARAVALDNEQSGAIDTDYTMVPEPPTLTAGRHDAKKKTPEKAPKKDKEDKKDDTSACPSCGAANIMQSGDDKTWTCMACGVQFIVQGAESPDRAAWLAELKTLYQQAPEEEWNRACAGIGIEPPSMEGVAQATDAKLESLLNKARALV